MRDRIVRMKDIVKRVTVGPMYDLFGRLRRKLLALLKGSDASSVQQHKHPNRTSYALHYQLIPKN
jgi:hypothetical protein